MSDLVDHLPPDLRDALDEELGPPERVFGPASPQLRAAAIRYAGGCAILVLLAFALAFVAPEWVSIVALLAAGLLALAAATEAVKAFACRREMVVLCANGFLQRDPVDGVVIFRFDRVVHVRIDLRSQVSALWPVRRRRYTVTTRRGTEGVLDGRYAGILELGDQVARRVAERQLPAALRALQQGRTVTIGPFEVSRRGITRSGRRLDWAQATGVSVFNGRVEVRTAHGYWTAIDVHRLDDVYLFVTLAETLIRQAHPG